MYHIIFNATENYIKYASVLMTSIIHNTKIVNGERNKPYYFHILSDSISTPTQEKLQNLQLELSKIYPCKIIFHKVETHLFDNLPHLNGNHSAYWRILIGSYLPNDAKIVLYLDVDMIALCDVREIFAYKTEEHLLSAIPDFGRYANRVLKSKNTNCAKIVFGKNYFNSGFLLVDLEKFRAQNIESQCLEILKNYHLKFHDQDILNAIFQDSYQHLPFAYNFIVQAFGASICKDESKRHYNIHHTREEFQEMLKNPKILHYAGAKPWNTGATYVTKNTFVAQIWWDYAEKTPIFYEELKAESKALSYDFMPFDAGFMILNAKFLDWIKLPLNLQKLIQEGKTKATTQEILQNPQSNAAFEIGRLAIRLATSNKKMKYLVMLIRILRAKLRYAKI